MSPQNFVLDLTPPLEFGPGARVLGAVVCTACRDAVGTEVASAIFFLHPHIARPDDFIGVVGCEGTDLGDSAVLSCPSLGKFQSMVEVEDDGGQAVASNLVSKVLHIHFPFL